MSNPITFHQTNMVVMDATHYWAEFPEDTTVQDLIEAIKDQYPDRHGVITFSDTDLPEIDFDSGVFNITDTAYEEMVIFDIKLTYYYQDRSLSFYVILDD